MKVNIDIPADQAGSGDNFAVFENREDGVFWHHNGDWKRLSNSMKVVGLERDCDGNGWCYLIEAQDDDHRLKEVLLPRSMLAKNLSEFVGLLLDSGITVASQKDGQNALKEYILQANPNQRVRRVTQVGWTESGFLIGADHVGSNGGETVRLDTRVKSHVVFSAKGTLEEWKSGVALRCRGNSRLILSITSGLAGPIIGLLGEESGGFHLFGSTSIGKSTALRVCASVLGDPARVTKQWRTTANASEANCAAHNNLTLVMDEMGQADPKGVGEMIYMIGNDKGKSRLDRDSNLRTPYEWRLLVLSSGEVDVAGFISSGGRSPVRGGQLVRLVDVPADAGKGLGIFEDIQNELGPEQYARMIKEGTTQFHGAAIKAFLEVIVNHRDRIIEECRTLVSEFMECFQDLIHSGELKRKCRKFALNYAAGVVGIRYKILPFSEKEILEAIQICFEATIADQPEGVTADEEAMLSQIRHILQLNEANFRGLEDDRDDQRVIQNRYGYIDTSIGKKIFYVENSIFSKILCQNFSAKAVARFLAKRGHLELDPGGKNSVLRRFDGSLKRYYAIRDTVFESI